MHRPKVLFLDEVVAGLDDGSKDTLLRMLDQAAGWGTQMVYAAHDADQIPSEIKRAIAFRSGRIVAQGTIKEITGETVLRRRVFLTPTSEGSIASWQDGFPNGKTILPGAYKVFGEGRGEDLFTKRSSPDYGKPLIQIEGVDVSREGKRILRGINWTMKPRENWAIVGKNGSGKTTMLKLIAGTCVLCGAEPSGGSCLKARAISGRFVVL